MTSQPPSIPWKTQPQRTSEGTHHPGFWYETISHNGSSPFIPNGERWRVFRNIVVHHGADPTGSIDSQAAFKEAILDGAPTDFRRDTDSLGTTGQAAVVYIPPGMYVLDSPLQLYVGTVLMGDPTNPPTLRASKTFKGKTMIYGKDPHHDSTCNFFIGIKNIRFDSTNLDPSTQFTILDWSVSQATQLTNVVFDMPNYSTGHTGIAMPEGGSGTFMGDLVFNGGFTGINLSSQQYEIKSVSFNRCTIGILISGCFVGVLVDLSFADTGTGIDMSLDGGHSLSLIDSTAANTGTVIKTRSATTADHSLVVENFEAGPGLTSVVLADERVILAGSVADTWVYGVVQTGSKGVHCDGIGLSSPRPKTLLSEGKFVAKPPPTYYDLDLECIVNVKDVEGLPVLGDGSTDDTINLTTIVAQNAGHRILFFPHGTYIVSNTLLFPVGTRLIGEGWSAISAIGSLFMDSENPRPMVKVGNPGDIGNFQCSDMLFTVAEILPGCVLVEVNMAGESPGDVGFWNSHIVVGGAAGSKVQTDCSGDPQSGKAAFMLLHLTASSSVYIENMWAWTADHDLDGGHDQTTIATGRGILIEATAGTWLHGTASEHNTLYQYNFHRARNVFVGMQQGEAPYWQGCGSPSLAPHPWTPLLRYGDPTFSECRADDARSRMAWYNIIHDSALIFIYGSGFWTFFNHGDQSCQGTYCQMNASKISGNATDIYWFNLNTKSNLNMIEDLTSSNVVKSNDNKGSWDAVIAAYLLSSHKLGSQSKDKLLRHFPFVQKLVAKK